MSDTPRVEAVVGPSRQLDPSTDFVKLAGIYSALLSLARELERELAEATTEFRYQSTEHGKALHRIEDLERRAAYAKRLLDAAERAAIALECGGTFPIKGQIWQGLADALAKNQCGGSRSLTEAPLPSTAQPLPAAHKAEQLSDAGPSAHGPASQREPRTTGEEYAERLQEAIKEALVDLAEGNLESLKYGLLSVLHDPPGPPVEELTVPNPSKADWRCWSCSLVQRCQGTCEGCGGTDLWPVACDYARTGQCPNCAKLAADLAWEKNGNG